MTESVVLCEGYHDRQFWKGWLMFLGCGDLLPPGQSAPVVDPWGLQVSRGDFGLQSKSEGFLRIRPCGGKNKILPAARFRLRQRGSQSLGRLVIGTDSDVEADDPTPLPVGPSDQAVEQLVKEFDAEAVRNPEGDWMLSDPASVVSVVRWTASDPHDAGLPEKQTLERLVCAAMVAAYPRRGPEVQGWLDSRSDPPAPDPKEHAWSHMAGWYATHGCENFYRQVWREPEVARQLEVRLRESGAWRIAETLAG